MNKYNESFLTIFWKDDKRKIVTLKRWNLLLETRRFKSSIERLEKQLAGISLLSIVVPLCIVRGLDSFTAYLCFRFKPELFLSYEINSLTVSAYYYGAWQSELMVWGLFFSLILVVVLLYHWIPKIFPTYSQMMKSFLKLFLLGFIFLYLGGVFANLCALLFG